MDADLLEKLLQPFPDGELKFFPVALTKDKTKAKVGTYADVRAYMDHLDRILGPDGWQTSYTLLEPATKAVECQLRIRAGGEWIARADVGYPNEAEDAGKPGEEPLKAAYSDALKRACVQFGVGRFLYSVELVQDWLEWDESKRRWAKDAPRLKRQATQQRAAVANAGRPQAAPATSKPAETVQATPAPSQAPTEGCKHEDAELQPDGSTLCPYCGELWPADEPVNEDPIGAWPDPNQPVDQMGEFAAETGGGVNLVKFLRYANDQQVTRSGLALIAPHPSGKAGAIGIEEWLRQHPNQTLFDLVRLARENVQPASQEPAARQPALA